MAASDSVQEDVMPKITRKDLTESEWTWLKNLNQGGGASAMLTVEMANRLKELGLAEQKLGGTGISREGKRVVTEYVVASRRAHGLK